MNMLKWLIALATLSLIFTAFSFVLLLNAKGDIGFQYLLLSMIGGGCSCLFVGLACLRKAHLSPSPGKLAFWVIAGSAALLPVAYILGIC